MLIELQFNSNQLQRRISDVAANDVIVIDADTVGEAVHND